MIFYLYSIIDKQYDVIIFTDLVLERIRKSVYARYAGYVAEGMQIVNNYFYTAHDFNDDVL